MKIKLIFKWFDFWIGMYYDVKDKTLYILPFPMIGIRVQFKFKTDERLKTKTIN